MNIDSSALSTAFAHAKECEPRESCGFLIANGKKQSYFPCENSAVGSEHFIISAEEYARAEDAGEILAIVHSHPNASPRPSMADLVSCGLSELPWLILGVDNTTHWMEPEGYKAPLVGRPFVHGVLDCYSLLRDWYKQEMNIEMDDFERRDLWWEKGDNLYIENFASQGLQPIGEDEELQVGDMILMQINADVTNHAAVYIGDGVILHHLYDRLSCKTIYGGYYQTVTTHRLRHVSCAK